MSSDYDIDTEMDIYNQSKDINPIILIKEQEEEKLNQYKEMNSNIRVTFVVKSMNNYDKDIIEGIQTLCKNNYINFIVREYNSDIYEEDRENIVKLPAFNIYLHNNYETTFYLGNNYEKIIEDKINEVRQEWEGNNKKKEYWTSQKSKIKMLLISLFGRFKKNNNKDNNNEIIK